MKARTNMLTQRNDARIQRECELAAAIMARAPGMTRDEALTNAARLLAGGSVVMPPNPGRPERLFIGSYPTGYLYSDRDRDDPRTRDYRRLAFLPFSTLKLEWSNEDVPALNAAIRAHAAGIIAKRGQQHEVDSCGHTVILGGNVPGWTNAQQEADKQRAWEDALIERFTTHQPLTKADRREALRLVRARGGEKAQ